MDTSRAVINIIDNSETFIQETTEITGFTVVKAPKGPITPVKISKGGAAELKDIFGVSSKDYPELFEAETFNREYDLYVSAPYLDAKVPVAFLTKSGVVLGSSLMAYNPTIESYALGETDSLATTGLYENQYQLMNVRTPESYGLPGKVPAESLIPTTATFNNNSGLLINTGIKIRDVYTTNTGNSDTLGHLPEELRVTLSNGTNLDYTRSNTIIKRTINNSPTNVGYLVKKGPNDVLSEIVADATSEDLIYIFFNCSNPNSDSGIPNVADAEVRQNLKIYWKSALNSSNVYAIIFPKFPSTRALHISFNDFSEVKNYSSESYRSWNNLKMRVYEEGAYRDSSNPIYIEGSLDTSDKASDGSFLGFSGLNSSYMNQNLVCVYPVKKFTETSDFVSTIKGFGSIVLKGGSRTLDSSGTGTTDDIHTKGWKAAADGEYSDVDIFFDSEIHEGTDPDSKFLSLATDNISSHELAGYIFNKTLGPTDLTDDSGKEKDNLGSKRLSFGYNYWNVCNIGIVEDRTNGTRFSVAMTGAKALMQARIIEYKMGGVAPMWENTSVSGVSLGGQLNMINIYKLKYRYTKKQLDILDDLNYNPIINDRQYGIMSVGQKTSKDGATTDWSYIGHASAFLNFLKQVRANVMLPQIGKPNNPYYRTLRKDQVDLYLGQRINGSDRIWAEAECDTSTADGVNDVHALKARKFVIKVRVKVDVFSEKVELNFTNEGQDTIISMAQ